jgi:hypothetical protein
VTNPDPNAAREENILSRRSSLLGLGLIAVLFVLSAVLTWRKWPDVLIDYGMQLYVPWRILNGAVLYRDLFYIGGGPLTQYFNALLFKILGVSFSTLIAANLLFASATIFLIYRRFLAAADAWTAAIIGAGVVLVFAFAEYTPIGNYDYIAPYSYDVTYGLMLSILAIALLSDWINTRKIYLIFLAGFCTGLVFLTKPDVFMALAVGAVAAFVLFYLRHGLAWFLKSIGAFAAAGIVPSLIFFFFFLHVENPPDSLRSIFAGWLPLLQGTIVKSPYYQWVMGLDMPAAHLWEIMIYSLAVVLAVAIYAFVFRWMKNQKWIKSPQIALLLVMLPALIWAVRFDWRQCGWPLPLLGLSACILMAWNYRRLEPAAVFPLLWSVFGLALLSKLGLLPRVWHYGFALAMPAFVSSIYLLFHLLPGLLEERFGVPAKSFRIMVGVVLLIGFANLFDQSQLIYARKSLPLGAGGDEIITYNSNDPSQSEKSQGFYAALLWTEKYMPRDATMVALPEGIMLNYLTRHVNPTPCLDWNPNYFTVFGQDTITDACEQHPPDYIFLVDWDSSEFGAGNFGSTPDYGQALMQWIQKNYKTQILIGHEPLKDGRFGIKILKRIAPTPQEPSRGGGPE